MAEKLEMFENNLSDDYFSLNLPTYPSVFQSERPSLDEGDKIVLPEKILHDLMHGIGSTRSLPNPLIFSVENVRLGKTSHCGVLEFSGLDIHAFLPQWLMENLLLQPGDSAKFSLVEKYPILDYVRLKPSSSKFIETFQNPKNILEEAFRKFTALTRGDTILLKILEKCFTFHVCEIRSKKGTENFGCIVNSDLEVDLDVPLKSPRSKIAPLKEGEKITDFTREKEPKFFSFKRTSGKGIAVSLNSIHGDADLYVSQSISKPSSEENDWEDYSKQKRKRILIPFNVKAQWLYVAVSCIKGEVSFELQIDNVENAPLTQLKQPQLNAPIENSVYCENCHGTISERNFSTHSLHCKRAQWWCERCGKTIPFKEKPDHVHCEKCGTAFKQADLEKHVQLKHSMITCECGIEYPLEKRVEHLEKCALAMCTCKYCGSVQRKKDLSDHEEYCGGRTNNCEMCGKIVCLRDIQNHRAAEHGINPKCRSQQIEDAMIEKAMRESLKDVEESLAEGKNRCVEGRPADSAGGGGGNLAQKMKERRVKCPYCNRYVGEEVDIGVHMLKCYRDK